MSLRYMGRSNARYPLDTPKDSANLILAVDENKISFFVNGLMMHSALDTSLDKGNLALTLLSGTNKGYGTYCGMENIELFTLRK